MTSRTLGRVAIAAVAALLVALAFTALQGASRHRALPLSHASVIREQAAAKHVDPALIAAVIYAESKFEPRPSAAGGTIAGRDGCEAVCTPWSTSSQ